MNALYITVFVSFVLVSLGVIAFLHSRANGDADHLDRLALLPLENDDATPAPAPPTHEELHDRDRD